MQILEVIQRASRVVGVATPEAVFASDDRTSQELAAIANQAAEDIADEFDWSRLRVVATITGDGTSQAFDLPSDFARFYGEGRLIADNGTRDLEHVTDHGDWLDFQVGGFPPVFGAWTVLGGRIELLPILADGTVVKYMYQSRNIVRSQGTAETGTGFPYTLPFILPSSDAYGYQLERFQVDSDHYQLDWKLLEKAIVWRWKANKGLPYAEALQDYTRLLSQRINEDGGRKPVMMGGCSPTKSRVWPKLVP